MFKNHIIIFLLLKKILEKSIRYRLELNFTKRRLGKVTDNSLVMVRNLKKILPRLRLECQQALAKTETLQVSNFYKL